MKGILIQEGTPTPDKPVEIKIITIPLNKVSYEDLEALTIEQQTQLFAKDKEIERLKADLHEANDSVTWWNNRYNAIVKQNDDNHKKLVKEQEEIKRLKEEYIILQNASDEVEEELQQRIDKAIEYIENETTYSDYKEMDTLINILKGSDKE